MHNHAIFPVVPTKLYSIYFTDQPTDAYRQWRDDHTNATYLYEYFTRSSHLKRISEGTYTFPKSRYFTVDQACQATVRAADELDRRLMRAAKKGAHNGTDAVLKDFDFLHKRESGRDFPFTSLKLKLNRKPNWLRLYGIQFRGSVFITGGGIKLTATMQEDPDLQEQLDRIEAAREFLQENEHRLIKL